MTERCANCGRPQALRLLDSKPASLKGIPATDEMLAEAADRGEDFDVLECRRCYGPAWSPGEADVEPRRDENPCTEIPIAEMDFAKIEQRLVAHMIDTIILDTLARKSARLHELSPHGREPGGKNVGDTK